MLGRVEQLIGADAVGTVGAVRLRRGLGNVHLPAGPSPGRAPETSRSRRGDPDDPGDPGDPGDPDDPDNPGGAAGEQRELDRRPPQPPPGSCHARGSGCSSPDPRCTPGAISPAVTQADITSTI